MQTLFIRGPSATFRMIILVIASIVLMTVDHRWQSMEVVRSAMSGVVYPLQYTIDLPIRLYYWADEILSSKQELLDKNREFEARHLENRVQLQKLDIIEKENARLRKLLSATSKKTERLLISEIINVDVDPYRQLILLNKGTNNDVYRGQPIIDAQGIVGQILHVGPMSSTAILITDASHAMPVQIDRTGLRANAFGTGKIDQLKLRYLPHNVDVKVGDMLISSGLGGTFPPNYPVATITKVERPPGEPFAAIEAMPLAQLDKSREVLLVWLNTPELERQAFDFDNVLTGETSDEPSADAANNQASDPTDDQTNDQVNKPDNDEQGEQTKNEGGNDSALSGGDTSE
jgi:rod shape-determining protein MreC